MTYSKLGIDGILSEQPDPRTGKAIPVFIPTLDPTGKEIPVYLYKSSRPLGTYIIGLQGMGKSGLLEELILADIKQDIGVCVLDPHGELVDNIIARLPDGKEEKVIYLDLAESQYFFGLNLFACSDPTSERKIAETRSLVLHVFEKAFGISPSTPLMYDLLHKSASVLIANPGYTMVDISLFLTDETCRKMLIQHLARPDIRGFWERWDNPKLKLPKDREQDNQTILNKLNDFEDEPLRYIVGQSVSTIDLRSIMDEGKILLIKLDRRLEQATKLVGSIIVALILTASASWHSQRQFHLYADEFQNFATEDFAVLLEEARKSGIGITMAHQNRTQLELSDTQADKNLKARTLNVGNMVVFRVPTDADSLAAQFNITPQPAWEEMIEEERVQILKEEWVEVLKEAWVEELEPERHRKVEEVVEDGVEEIKTPVANPVEFLLSKGRHPDPTVMAFVDTYLRKIEEAVAREGASPATGEIVWRGNSFFQEMDGVTHNGYRDTFHDYFKESASLQNFIPGFRLFVMSVITANNPVQPISLSLFPEIISKFNFGKGVSLLFGFPDIIRWLGKDEKAFPSSTSHQSFNRIFSCLLTSPDGHLQASFQEKQDATITLRDLVVWDLKDQREFDELSDRRHFGHKLDRNIIPYDRLSNPQTQEGQTLTQHIAYEITQAQAFFGSLRAFLKGLLAQPVLVPSGQYQPRKRTQIHYLTHPRKTIAHPPLTITHPRETITHPRKTILHPQRTYADVQGEIANELVRLPKFTARVKLSDGSGNTVEHTIQTLKPERGLYGQALKERQERIRQRNIREGYIRDRSTVEAEIKNRQAQCSQQVVSSSHQPAHQSPPAARKAKLCSVCGASNQQGANFCIQCGTKL